MTGLLWFVMAAALWIAALAYVIEELGRDD